MTWQRRSASLALVAILASACSGGDVSEPQTAPTTTIDLSAPTTTTTTEAATTTKAIVDTSDVAPRTLAFASSDDIGRLFEISGSVAPAESAGSETVGDLLFDGLVVQATNLRSRDASLWVRINDVEDGSEFGWVTSNSLRPTTRTVDIFDANRTTEFRKVSRVVANDVLDVFAAPGEGVSPIGGLIETEIAMHGGNTVVTADGQRWVDVVAVSSGARTGWVNAESFSPLSSIEAKAPDGTDVDRRADSTVAYGGDLSNGVVSAIGCNAQQITFVAQSSSLGSAIVFGNTPPVGRPLDSTNTRFQWSSSGGSTVFIDPGETVTFSFPSQGAKTWFFTTLGEDGQAAHEQTGGQAVLDPAGRAIAIDVQRFEIPAGSCAAPETPEPKIDPYVYELPEDERDEAIAAFEAELAAWRAANDAATETVVEGAAEEALSDDATLPPGAGTGEDTSTTTTTPDQ